MINKSSLLLAALCIAPLGALAQGTFPNKPIKLVIAFPAGGPTDITMRSLAERHLLRSANTSSPPAMPMSSETQPMPEIIGLSHSSK